MKMERGLSAFEFHVRPSGKLLATPEGKKLHMPTMGTGKNSVSNVLSLDEPETNGSSRVKVHKTSVGTDPADFATPFNIRIKLFRLNFDTEE
jgi:hypothetical protein